MSENDEETEVEWTVDLAETYLSQSLVELVAAWNTDWAGGVASPFVKESTSGGSAAMKAAPTTPAPRQGESREIEVGRRFGCAG